MKDKKIVSPIYLAKPKNEWFSEYDSVENREVLGGYKDMETLLKNSISINHDNTKTETKNNNSTNKQTEAKMVEIKEKKQYDINQSSLVKDGNQFIDSQTDKNKEVINQNTINNKNIEKIIPTIVETSKVISNNISEVNKEKLKEERNKENNTFDFGKKLIDNGNTEEGINFVKSERDKDRKYRIITKVCDTVEKILIVGMFIYLIFCKETNKNNNNSSN